MKKNNNNNNNKNFCVAKWFYSVIMILIKRMSFFEYGPVKIALFGTRNPVNVLLNSWETRSLVGVT